MIKRSPRFLIFLICILILELLYVGYEHYKKRQERLQKVNPLPVDVVVFREEKKLPVIVLLSNPDGVMRNALAVALLRDGKIIWSNTLMRHSSNKDCDIYGGPPYYEGYIDKDKVSRLLTMLKENNIYSDKEYYDYSAMLDFDQSFFIATIMDGNNVISLVSKYKYIGLEDRPIKRRKRYMLYMDVLNTLLSLRPTTGKEVDIHYDIKELECFESWKRP